MGPAAAAHQDDDACDASRVIKNGRHVDKDAGSSAMAMKKRRIESSGTVAHSDNGAGHNDTYTAPADAESQSSHSLKRKSLFTFPPIPMDPIFKLANECAADPDPSKINLSIGAYRDENGKPWVLPVVKKVEKMLIEDSEVNHEYLPIDGIRSFTDASARLILGSDSPAIKENRFVAVQTVSGTGAVRLGADFLAKFRKAPVYISDPTWGNHFDIFGDTGFDVRKYKYWDGEKRRLAFDSMVETFKNAPDGSIIVLHACAHNPTGVDPTPDQWRTLATLLAEKHHLPFFDCAYQGFATGSLDADAFAVRLFVERGFELLVAQSYSKNFGLYAQRAGALVLVSCVTGVDDATRSQLCRLNRACISNPPAFGARIVDRVLNDPVLYKEWTESLSAMATRINKMRSAVHSRLCELETPGDWTHITSQIGMFCFTGLNQQQCLEMKKRFHVYMAENGRISVAGLNSKNVSRFAEALDWVVRNVE